MANDKDFVVNGPVVVGKDTKVTVGTVTSGAVDLSTGNYFVDSPSGAYTYSFTNPGAVQAFQIEATGGSPAVASAFSTTLFDSGGGVPSATVTNGIDLATDGGLVWVKSRTNQGASLTQNNLSDTERGTGRKLITNLTNAEIVGSYENCSAFNNNGFTYADGFGDSSNKASWTFKKQAKFFDIVTWTGTGSTRTIAHNLGVAPGMIIVKAVSGSALNGVSNWTVYHRGVDASYPEQYRLYLDSTSARVDQTNPWNDTAPTSSLFTIGTDSYLNANGDSFIAYIFAHDTASDGLIQCGRYTGTATSVAINLGWQPQWLLIKKSDGNEDWSIVDNVRGMGTDPLAPGLKALAPNSAVAEETPTYSPIVPSSTGFTAHTGYDARYCANGGTYVYMAIRSASAPAITWPTSIEWTQGTTPKTPAEGATDVYTFTTDDGGTTYTGIQSIDTAS